MKRSHVAEQVGYMAKSDSIQIMIVDDHPAIRDALREAIGAKMGTQVIADVASEEDAFNVLRKQVPDVAIVDLSLADSHGLNLVQNLSVQYPQIKVIVYSMYDEDVYAERAIRAGASGYVMKSEPTTTALEAIHSVMRGEIFLSRRLASQILNKVAVGRSSEPGFPIDDLTDREMSVFQMLGEGYSVEDITERLKLTRKTVETYRRRAKEKLGFDSVAELLQHAVQWTHAQGGGQGRAGKQPRDRG
jgi:DNA-binding NarL/FixJ family response regulator